ncbi:hypothetical protein D3C72_1864630 [compost metagenome]
MRAFSGPLPTSSTTGAPGFTPCPTFTCTRATLPANGATKLHCAICASKMRTWLCALFTLAAASSTSISAADCRPCSFSLPTYCTLAASCSARAAARRAWISSHS